MNGRNKVQIAAIISGAIVITTITSSIILSSPNNDQNPANGDNSWPNNYQSQNQVDVECPWSKPGPGTLTLYRNGNKWVSVHVTSFDVCTSDGYNDGYIPAYRQWPQQLVGFGTTEVLMFDGEKTAILESDDMATVTYDFQSAGL